MLALFLKPWQRSDSFTPIGSPSPGFNEIYGNFKTASGNERQRSATRIQQHVVAATGETSIGVIRRRLRLTRNPRIPCVLCECACLTNAAEARNAATASYRRRIAQGIVQEKLGDAGIAPVPEIWARLSAGSDRPRYTDRTAVSERRLERPGVIRHRGASVNFEAPVLLVVVGNGSASMEGVIRS
jgi:hypothetical protein